MSSGNNNFSPFPRNWPTTGRGYGYDANTPNNSDSIEVPVFHRSRNFQATPDATVGAPDPWQPLPDRTITRLFSISSFPGQAYSRRPILIVGNDMGGGFSPRLREVMQETRPRFIDQPNMQGPTMDHDNYKLTENEQKKALEKLKKEIYNPVPKRLALSLYYRDNARNALKEREKNKEDGKNCAICLEDFEAGQEVMLTPCNHMFHEDCIVPWVKSQGQCPVCRFTICEKMKPSPPSFNNNNNNGNMAAATDIFSGDFVSVLRAMQGFHLDN
ncbi:putative RING/U-box superfamily protein [Quillaja saponaria]|uniref:RING/U-box superfamily protein n=1 Tax=Quillaja saponaria TaxID=32244 RepID=A0AAD7QHF1_QUISA|nr:putative RING/U-box superfamily protein [Quillaja saponaria]